MPGLILEDEHPTLAGEKGAMADEVKYVDLSLAEAILQFIWRSPVQAQQLYPSRLLQVGQCGLQLAPFPLSIQLGIIAGGGDGDQNAQRWADRQWAHSLRQFKVAH